jgi:hypothetical protein
VRRSVYHRSSNPSTSKGIADLRTFDGDYWEDGGEAIVRFKMECGTPWSLEVLGVDLVRQVSVFFFSFFLFFFFLSCFE